MRKEILYTLSISIIFFVTSCGPLDSVKRGLTGEKQKSIDEFLIKKKDPLILPPDYENLPIPDDSMAASEEISAFEKALETSIEDNSSITGSVEDSILKKIKLK